MTAREVLLRSCAGGHEEKRLWVQREEQPWPRTQQHVMLQMLQPLRPREQLAMQWRRRTWRITPSLP